MTPAQRFVTKLARASSCKRPRVVIDRPGAMLYDVPYPVFIRQLAAQSDMTGTWEISTSAGTRPLYSE
jgi:hypothetical protein